MKLESQLVQFPAAAGDPYRSSTTPIYQTATFQQPDALGGGEFDYTRSGNPTRRVLEDQVALLEGGSRGLAFASGMAAITVGITDSLVRYACGVEDGKDLLADVERALEAV